MSEKFTLQLLNICSVCLMHIGNQFTLTQISAKRMTQEKVRNKSTAYCVGNSNKLCLFHPRKDTRIKIISEFIRLFYRVTQYLFEYFFFGSFACGEIIVLTIKVYFDGVFSALDPKHLGRPTVYYTASKILILQYDASMPKEYHNSDLL